VAAGSAQLGAAVTVQFLDAQGERVTSGPLAGSVIMLTTADPMNGLAGTTVVEAVAGLATFSDLRVVRAGPAIRLVATGGGLASALSNEFAVSAVAPAAPSVVLLDSGPVVNWGVPFSDGGSDIAHYFVVASGSSAPYSVNACAAETGPSPTVPATISALDQPVFFRRMPGPLSCGFTAPAGTGVRLRVFAVNASGQVSAASALTSGNLD
jgi:hypothetical protein